MKCFECIVEYKLGPIGPKEAATQYKGTYLCVSHAVRARQAERSEMTLPAQTGKAKDKRLTQ